MPAAKKAQPRPRPGLLARTPIAEWVAAGLGLLLTLLVLGYSLWEGIAASDEPPSLSVSAEAAKPTAGGYVVPVVVRNHAHRTAGQVEVRGVLESAGAVAEERRAVFSYVPGRGEARGGLVFSRDPAAYTLKVSPEGYEDP